MCDASDIFVGAVLEQKKERKHHVICYISKTLDPAQRNYSTTEKEMLAVVYAFKRPHQYLICSKVVVFTDSSALKFLMTKRDAKPRLFRLELLLQEFDFELKDQKGSEIVVAHHLSRLPEPNDESSPIQDEMFEETLMTTLVVGKAPWFADIANYLACRELPEFESRAMKKAFFVRVGNFF